ncbi:MAG: hypothetical protein JW947_07255, partial [Sedimentisphaerales bacterium]|nr:hypothetical protein [Sedimentisphaerales bacterium]
MDNLIDKLMLPYFIYAIIFSVIVAAAIYGILASRKRRLELAQWALKNELTFSNERDRHFGLRYSSFDCLNRGDSRYAYNIMKGAIAGRVFTGCDYHYATGSGKSRHHYNFSLVIVKSPILLEPLFIRPENIFDKFTELVGFNDIDFESSEFSKKFYVKAPNKKWAYDIIHPRMMEFLLSSPVFTIQFDFLSVIVYRDRLFSPAEFTFAVEFINGFFDLIPDYVI